MFTTAAVAVPAGADFVVEGAVHFVLLRAEDGGEVAVGEKSVLALGCGMGKGEERGGLTWPYLWCGERLGACDECW